MTDTNLVGETEMIEVDALMPYPGNPKRGDVEAIAESLRANGQYRPIVVNRRDGTILAGNHTWRAARSLGWDRIAVTFVDVDEAAAKRIVIADNRTHDLGSYDDDALLNMLRDTDLTGTGYAPWDVEEMEIAALSDELFDDAPASRRDNNKAPKVVVGTYGTTVDPDVFHPWHASLVETHDDKSDIADTLLRRLGLDRLREKPTAPKAPKRRQVTSSEVRMSMEEVEEVEVSTLTPYPNNARRGDVGAISESLRVNGQYRPIVVNRSDRTILVGNHTWRAAKALGWERIAVAWVDVDDEAAKRIVLADNRTAEMGFYDDDELADLLVDLAQAEQLEGTGYDGDDVDHLLRQVGRLDVTDAPGVRPPRERVPVKFGPIQSIVERESYDQWERAMQEEWGYRKADVLTGIMQALGFTGDDWPAKATEEDDR